MRGVSGCGWRGELRGSEQGMDGECQGSPHCHFVCSGQIRVLPQVAVEQ